MQQSFLLAGPVRAIENAPCKSNVGGKMKPHLRQALERLLPPLFLLLFFFVAFIYALVLAWERFS